MQDNLFKGMKRRCNGNTSNRASFNALRNKNELRKRGERAGGKRRGEVSSRTMTTVNALGKQHGCLSSHGRCCEGACHCKTCPNAVQCARAVAFKKKKIFSCLRAFGFYFYFSFVVFFFFIKNMGRRHIHPQTSPRLFARLWRANGRVTSSPAPDSEDVQETLTRFSPHYCLLLWLYPPLSPPPPAAAPPSPPPHAAPCIDTAAAVVPITTTTTGSSSGGSVVRMPRK